MQQRCSLQKDCQHAGENPDKTVFIAGWSRGEWEFCQEINVSRFRQWFPVRGIGEGLFSQGQM